MDLGENKASQVSPRGSDGVLAQACTQGLELVFILCLNNQMNVYSIRKRDEFVRKQLLPLISCSFIADKSLLYSYLQFAYGVPCRLQCR